MILAFSVLHAATAATTMTRWIETFITVESSTMMNWPEAGRDKDRPPCLAASATVGVAHRRSTYAVGALMGAPVHPGLAPANGRHGENHRDSRSLVITRDGSTRRLKESRRSWAASGSLAQPLNKFSDSGTGNRPHVKDHS